MKLKNLIPIFLLVFVVIVSGCVSPPEIKDDRCSWKQGTCDALIEDNYYFDKDQGKCVQMPAGSSGCSDPPFEKLEDCQSTCKGGSGKLGGTEPSVPDNDQKNDDDSKTDPNKPKLVAPWWSRLTLDCGNVAAATGLNLGDIYYGNEKVAVVVEGDDVYSLNVENIPDSSYMPPNTKQVRLNKELGCSWTLNSNDQIIKSIEDIDIYLDTLAVSLTFDDADKFRDLGFIIYTLFADYEHRGIKYEDVIKEVLANPNTIDYNNKVSQQQQSAVSDSIPHGEGGVYSLVVNPGKYTNEDHWYEISDTKLYLFFKKNHCLVYIKLGAFGNDKYNDYHPYDDEQKKKVNAHPEFDHGEQEIVAQAKELASKIDSAIGKMCGGLSQKEYDELAAAPVGTHFADSSLIKHTERSSRYT